MADLALTATAVVAGVGCAKVDGLAGETVTAGQIAYQDPTTLLWLKADNNAAGKTHPQGMFLNGAAVNQPVEIAKSGPVTIGGTMTAGVAYYLSGTAGGICPVADLTTGMIPSLLGFAMTASILNLAINFSGVTL